MTAGGFSWHRIQARRAGWVAAASTRFALAWNRFFYLPEPVTGIAVFRILWGLVLLVHWALLAPDVLTWFGERGVLSGEAATRIAGGRSSPLLFRPASDVWVVVLFVASVLASIGLTAGFLTRASACATFLGLVSFHHRNLLILNGGDTLLRTVTFLLVFAPAGHALSIDRWLRTRFGGWRDEPVLHPPWAQRLIQIQVAVVYLSTFLWKIQGSTWRDGTAIYFTSRLPEFQRFPLPLAFEDLATIKILTWGSLLLEFGLGVLIWIRPLRYPLLVAGATLHLA